MQRHQEASRGKDHIHISPAGTMSNKHRECTETAQWDGHWMDFTFFESRVVKTRVKSYITYLFFQITAIMKMLSNHSWDHMPGNIIRNKRINSLTVEISFSTEKHGLNRWV